MLVARQIPTPQSQNKKRNSTPLPLQYQKFNLAEPRSSHPSKTPKDYDPFRVEKLLGTGGYAVVNLVKNPVTREEYAYKTNKYKTLGPNSEMKNAEMTNEERKNEERLGEKMLNIEMQIMEKISHGRCIRYIRRWKQGMLLPVKDCDLFSIIEKKELSEKATLRTIYDVALAINHLHEKNILHRDIKPENILVDKDGYYLADYGLSCELKDTRSEVTGSPEYVSPEILAKKPYNKSTDIWSLGVVMYVCLHGEVPYDPVVPQTTRITSKIRKNTPLILKPHPVGFKVLLNSQIASSPTRQLLRGMLTYNPNDRLTIQQVLIALKSIDPSLGV